MGYVGLTEVDTDWLNWSIACGSGSGRMAKGVHQGSWGEKGGGIYNPR